MKVRLSVGAWKSGADDVTRFCLPSLLQDENVPWLLDNGVDVAFTVYTIASDAQHLAAVVESTVKKLASAARALSARIEVIQNAEQMTPSSLKHHWIVRECEAGIRERSPILLSGADGFWGNGTIANLAAYCHKPGIVTGAVYMRVDRAGFEQLLDRYRTAHGDRPISNAKLVDVGLRCAIPSLRESDADNDTNSSFHTGGSWRRLDERLHGLVVQLPSQTMFWPERSDIDFLNVYSEGRPESLDHMWQAKLIAEGRWRVMASTDLAFLVEPTPADVAARQHSYPCESGRLYNDDFYATLPHTLANRCGVISVRSEPFLD